MCVCVCVCVCVCMCVCVHVCVYEGRKARDRSSLCMLVAKYAASGQLAVQQSPVVLVTGFDSKFITCCTILSTSKNLTSSTTYQEYPRPMNMVCFKSLIIFITRCGWDSSGDQRPLKV